MVPSTFAEKRPYNPRGQPHPRSTYSQQPSPAWSSKQANSTFPPPSPTTVAPIEYPDYRGSSAPNYYGPPSMPLQTPRNPPVPIQTPAPEVPVEPPQPIVAQAKSPPQPASVGTSRPLPMSLLIPQPSIAESIKEEAPPPTSKQKPQPLIQVVSDPHLTLDPSLPLPSSIKIPRPSPLPLQHATSTKTSNRIIEQVVAPPIPTPLPLTVAVAVGIHEEDPTLANLPAPPPLEGPSESSGSVSSLGRRPRVAWGQGLRRRSSIESELPPNLPAKVDLPDSTQIEMEPFPTDPPLENALDIEEEAVCPEESVEVQERLGEKEDPPPLEEEAMVTVTENPPPECQPTEAPPSQVEALKVMIPSNPTALPTESPRSKAKSGPGRPPQPPEENRLAKKPDKKTKKLPPGLTATPHLTSPLLLTVSRAQALWSCAEKELRRHLRLGQRWTQARGREEAEVFKSRQFSDRS
jgi:hypothetical protein